MKTRLHPRFFIDIQSYQGRTHIVSMLFFYFFALVSFVVPILILFKYASIILSLLSLLIVFFLARRLYTNKWVPLLVLALTSFTPALFAADINTLLPSSLFMVIYLALLYSFFHLEKKNAVFAFLILLIIATLVSSLSIVVIIGFVLYFILLRIEKLPAKRLEREVLFFGSMFTIWYYLIIYKKLFFLYGVQAAWRSIPREIFLSQFQGLTIPLALGLIGIIPFLLGLYAIYNSLFNQRNRRFILLVSLALSFGLFAWLGLLPLHQGLIYTTLTLSILSGQTLQELASYFKKTVVPQLAMVLGVVFILLFAFSFIPLIF